MKEAISQANKETNGIAADYFRARDQETVDSTTSVDTMFGEMETLRRDGKIEEARGCLESIRRSPVLSNSQRERFCCAEAEFLVMDNELTEAEEMYNRALALNPDSPRALCGKGALAAERQEWAPAQTFFEKALIAQPKHDVALAGLGLCAMVAKREERALDLFVQAVSSNPENRRALLGVLQLGYPLKKYKEIESALNSYLELHPASVEMLYSLAGILFAQGKVEQAKVEVEKILIFEPEHPRALELRDIIKGEKPIQDVVL